MNSRCVLDYAKQLDFVLASEQAELMVEYGRLLLEKNKVLNLTAITDENAFVVKHLCDSLAAAALGSLAGETADVGTGGGFPGVVLRICRPELSVTLIDSVRKKIDAVAEICDKLGISIKTVHGRAEELGRKELRERYDSVTSRALARMPRLLEYCLPLVKTGGVFVAMKGPFPETETEEARCVESALGGSLSATRTYRLPDGIGRSLVIYHKTGAAQGIPRPNKRI